MDVEEIQTQGPSSKFPRLIGNGGSRNESVKLGQKYPYGKEEEDANRLRGWHHHSRIIRVSRASGGKDRHSKVLTSKGLRDRRVRLSVSTAIQFYDIQNRLGYDQPSKAVEWLIKAASESISELPSLNSNFPDTPKHLSDEKREREGTDQLDIHELDDHDPNDPSYHQQHGHGQQQYLSLSKSACSSTSETSKGSGLSLSRTEIRVNRVKKSRERARERTAKDKETTTTAATNRQQASHQEISLAPMSQSSSFTELLTGPGPNHHGARGHHQWISTFTPMDYFDAGQFLSRSHHHHQQQQPGFLGQIQLPGQAISIPSFTISGENSSNNHHQHQELQHFSFVPDHINLIPVTSHPQASEYNLNFTISPSSSSSGLAGFNRGTLQSNSNTASLLPHLQRFSSTSSVDVSNSNMPFFLAPAENHHQHLHIGQYSSGLHLYGDGTRHSSDHKDDKAKN